MDVLLRTVFLRRDVLLRRDFLLRMDINQAGLFHGLLFFFRDLLEGALRNHLVPENALVFIN
jgi:hypothetical protein